MREIKNIIKLPAGVLIFSLLIYATCRKNGQSELISGKIVYRSCATTVVEVTDPAFYAIAQDSWQQDPSRAARHHVFAVSNPCQLPKLDTGQVFRFRIDSSGKNDCIVCMMYDNPPQTKHMIKAE